MSKMYDVGIICCENKRIHGCPLCGGKPKVTCHMDKYTYSNYYKEEKFPISTSIECPNCGIKIDDITTWNKICELNVIL